MSSDYLSEEIDPVLLDFIKTNVNSFLKWDLIRFFYDHPDVTGTVETLAKYTGRNVSAVKQYVEELSQSGVLEKEEQPGPTIYTLTTASEMRAVVDEFASACRDRHFRLKVIHYIIRELRQ